MAKTNNKYSLRFPTSKSRVEYEKNRKKIIANCDVCAICGQAVDKTLPAHHPMSAEADHIIPVSRGGAVADIDNLQLVHRQCNLKKSNKIAEKTEGEEFNPLEWLKW